MAYSLSFRLKSYATFLFDFFIGYSNVKTIIRVVAARRLYKRVNAGAYRSNDADNIIWIYYRNFRVFRASITWDILLVAYVALAKQKYKIYFGKEIGKYHNKTILFNIQKDKINIHGFENYAAGYQLVCKQLEEQGNIVFPTHHDMQYWENKIYMYTRFKELGVRIPRTEFYTSFDKLIKTERSFPFLIKVPHSSGSYGLFNVMNEEYLHSIATDPIITANHYYIVQERLNITMDMRVILVGNEVVYFYWRKNNDKSKWRTTSTGNGSSVDFENFPEQWRQYIIDTFGKLNLLVGAFDIGWQNDDITTEPYIFEVSPSYDVNPRTKNPEHLASYGFYKRQLLFKDSFDRLFVEETFDVKQKAVALFFEKMKRS